MGLFDQLAEDARAAEAAAVTGRLGVDNRYWQDLGYAFQLHLPVDVTFGLSGTEVFPLVLNPTKISKTHPFAAELTPAQEGGILAEEQGVVMSELTISGHTGVAPFVGHSNLSIPLSGQAHFLRLQNACFLHYSELKKDPTISSKVRMTFHNYRDEEHWLVVPRSFRLERNEKRLFYFYEITLAIVGEADRLALRQPEDDAVLAFIKDASTVLAKSVAEMSAGLQELSALGPEIEASFRAVQSAGVVTAQSIALVNDVIVGIERVAGAVDEFLRATTRTILLPYSTVEATRRSLDALLATLVRAVSIPADVVQVYRRMGDSLDAILAYPEKFVEAFPVAAQRFLDAVAGPASTTQARLDAEAANTITYAQQLRSTALRPGDAERVAAGIYTEARAFPRYQGFRQYTVRVGDSLSVIAARELGDARRAIDLAIANQLKPPYISEEGQPGTLRAGQHLLVPTLSEGLTPDTVRSPGDRELGASQYDALLGRDFLLEAGSDTLFDLVVDTAGGSTDFKTVAGEQNVAQAVTVILATEQGSNPLFQQLGYDRLLGKAGTLDRLIEAQVRISNAIQRDPRIERVKGLRFSAAEDALEVDLEAQLIQNIQIRTIARVLS